MDGDEDVQEGRKGGGICSGVLRGDHLLVLSWGMLWVV